MAISYSTAIRTARMQVVEDAINFATGAGTLKLYSGVRPATGAAITTQTLLATLTFTTDCGTTASGALTLAAVEDDTDAAADGVATWARIEDGDAAFVADLSVGTAAPADLILSNTTIVAGGTVSITSGVLTEGNA